MSELKPCPFCGGEAKLIQKTQGLGNSPMRIINQYVAGCEKCQVYTKYYQSDIWQGKDGMVHIDANGAIDAIEAWNRRAKDEPEVLHNMSLR